MRGRIVGNWIGLVIWAAGMPGFPGEIPRPLLEPRIELRVREETAQPVRPGIPGRQPFWNIHATKGFMYAPAFDFKAVAGATAYRFTLAPGAGGPALSFEGRTPWEALSPVWNHVPVGFTRLTVEGLDQGKVVGLAGRRRFYRKAVFEGKGPAAVRGFSECGAFKLKHLYESSYVKHWLDHDGPDPRYAYYCYPSKMISAVIVGLARYGKLQPEARQKALAMASHAAEYLIRISEPEGSAYPHFPPTYRGTAYTAKGQNDVVMMNEPAGVAMAYLDLYDATGTRRYFEAAENIAKTYARTQRPDGTWPIKVRPATGAVVSANATIPIGVVRLFRRLDQPYGSGAFGPNAKRAMDWIIANPVRTFNWEGQFEDVQPDEPYKDLSKGHACDIAAYMLDHADENPGYRPWALELLRYAEDQFVEWSRPNPDLKTRNWMTPCAMEQYVFMMPINASATDLILGWAAAYRRTGEDLFLLKARAMANAMTVSQLPDGELPTYWHHTHDRWLNCSVFSANAMLTLEEAGIAAVLPGKGGRSGPAPSSARPLTISGSAREPVTLVCPEGPLFREMGTYLRNFLTDRGHAVRPGFAKTAGPGTQWVLATQSTLPFLRTRMAFTPFVAGARDEAHLLEARATGTGTRVLLVGKGEAGLRAAVARLVARVANDGHSLKLDARREVNDPFVGTREIILGNAGRRQCPEGSPFKDIDLETWPREKLQAYPELYWQFGFNCVQVAENGGYGSLTGPLLERLQKATLALAEGARKRGMRVSLFLWGDCPFVEDEVYCWNDPRQRAALQDHMEAMGRRYGASIDHYNVHIGDPGGCTLNGCDAYRTPQEITAAYLKVFRQYNPKVLGSLSTWANSAFWLHSPQAVDLANYREYFALKNPAFGAPLPGGATFLDAAFMPREIGIALHQTYNDDQAARLAKAGRPVDVWAWYTGDMEMNDNLYLAMHRVDEAYRGMPESARTRLRINSVEITFHGWPQIINAYCAAQKMLNPGRPLEAIEREFCVAGFGPQNAAAVLELYQACENGVLDPIPQPADFGTSGYNGRLAEVLEHAGTIAIPEGWKPNFAFPVPVRTYVDMLVARLRLTLAVSRAKAEVAKARAGSAPPERIEELKREALATLPDLPADPLFRQDAAVVRPAYKTRTIAEMIAAL